MSTAKVSEALLPERQVGCIGGLRRKAQQVGEVGSPMIRVSSFGR